MTTKRELRPVAKPTWKECESCHLLAENAALREDLGRTIDCLDRCACALGQPSALALMEDMSLGPQLICRLQTDPSDMHAALVHALNRLESIHETEPHLALDDDMAQLRAAVAKAEGRRP